MASSSPVHTVRLPAMAAYFALRLAGRLQLPSAVASALRASLMDGTLGPNGRKLMEMAGGGMPDAIVPFERDLLDIRVAAAHADRSHAFMLARHGVAVGAGHFIVQRHDVTYVDEVPDLASHPRAYGELLPAHGLDAACSLLLQLTSSEGRPQVEVPAEGDDLLHLHSPAVQVHRAKVHAQAQPHLARQGVRAAPEPPRAAASLVWPGTPQPRSVTLSPLPVAVEHGLLRLLPCRPEQAMELQAAALAGAWLRLHGEGHLVLMPLPDLTLPGDTRPAWHLPSGAVHAHTQLDESLEVLLPLEVLPALLRHVPWAVTSDPCDAVLTEAAPTVTVPENARIP